MPGIDLGFNIPVLHDGAGDELREHCDVRAEADDVSLRPDLPPVYVYCVGHGLEGVERNTHRKGDIHKRNSRARKSIYVLDKEIVILEKAQNSEVHHDRAYQYDFRRAVFLF